MGRTLKQPKPNAIRERVRALTDAQLAELIVALRFSTKLEQSVLAASLNEQRRRKKKEFRV